MKGAEDHTLTIFCEKAAEFTELYDNIWRRCTPIAPWKCSPNVSCTSTLQVYCFVTSEAFRNDHKMMR